jgi:hypothetical protein
MPSRIHGLSCVLQRTTTELAGEGMVSGERGTERLTGTGMMRTRLEQVGASRSSQSA